ncbi:MAG: hypothetical protein ACLGG5_06090, partial [Thermoleophilia bacterium]
ARRRIGARLWRKAHRATILVYVLGLLHAFGAGSDASAVWFRAWVLATAPVIGGLFAYRALGGAIKRARSRRFDPGRGRAAPGPRREAPIHRSPALEEA